jgi:hypothetical protein
VARLLEVNPAMTIAGTKAFGDRFLSPGFDPYWPRRGWPLIRISGGLLALFVGPW